MERSIGLKKILAYPDKYCAVLLDVVMPEMDGIQLLRHLRARNLTDKIPIFLITAEASDAITKEAYELGVMDVISKPIIPYIVQRRVNSVVELFQARKRLGNKVEQQQSELLAQARKVIELNQGMIEALSAAIEFRNGESGEHVRRIHDITHLLLLHTDLGAGMDEETIENIALASIMHDVGKIAIPDSILNKPAKLTPEEFEIMKTHTTQGAELLKRIPQLRGHESYQYACDIARHHHERWERQGLPRWFERRRDIPGGADCVAGGCLRCAGEQALLQGRIQSDGSRADDSSWRVRGVQSALIGAFSGSGRRNRQPVCPQFRVRKRHGCDH